MWILILAVMFLAFGAGLVIRWLSPQRKSGPIGWFILLGLMLCGFMMFFGVVSVRVQRHIPPPVEVTASIPEYRHIEPTFVNPPLVPMAPSPTQPTAASESIEEMWKNLTAPRINLEEVAETTSEAPTMGPSSPQELTNAARVILSASLPGADPFTQGWLVNAAKSILRIPVSSQEKSELHQAAMEAMAQDHSATMKVESKANAVVGAGVSIPHGDPTVHVNAIVEGKKSSPAGLALAKSIAALPRPDWVVNPPKQVGNVRKIVLESDPFATEEEARRQLDERMNELVLDRAITLSRASFDGNRFGVPNLEKLGLGGDYVRRELCTDEFVDTVDSSVGDMKKSYVLLEFNESQDSLLVDRAKSYARREGIVDTTLAASLVFGAVATLFGLLKIDTWTRGYYTKRLFLGVPAAIITVLTLLAWA
jgi:hypothetical protein